MSESEEILEQKKRNEEYRLQVTEAVAGDVELSYTIEGNEYQAEQLYQRIHQALQAHDAEHGSEEQQETLPHSVEGGEAQWFR